MPEIDDSGEQADDRHAHGRDRAHVRRLTGVGVGPGDPELVTVKAVRVLSEADLVFAPTTSVDKPSRAEEVVRAATGVSVRRLVFALDDTAGVSARRTSAWDDAGSCVLEAFRRGARRIAFATLGDPAVYSTFTYLAATIAALDSGVQIDTVPGITAMQDLASRSGITLAEGRETLTLIPAAGGSSADTVDAMSTALRGPGTVVVYKGGRHLVGLTAAIEAAGRMDQTMLGCELGSPAERIVALADYPADRAPYFSTLISPPRRGGRGAAL